MGNSVTVWQPPSQKIETNSLVVPYSGPEKVLSRQQYEPMLESRLTELVEADPKQAKQVLSASEEHQPTQYAIATENDPQAYPSLILNCDPMQTLLDQISWNEEGQILSLDKNDLPSLSEISETIPS